jgi:hypothetical protein
MSYIQKKCMEHGIPFSFITNGMTLSKRFVPSDLITRSDGVSVSLDGGPNTYNRKGGNFNQIWKGLQRFANTEASFKILNVLQKGVNSETIDDMVSVLELAQKDGINLNVIQFDTYADKLTSVKDNRLEHAETLSLEEYLLLLKNSSKFMSAGGLKQNVYLLVDKYQCFLQGISMQEARSLAEKLNMTDYIYFAEGDPSQMGIEVAMANGRVLSVWEHLNTGLGDHVPLPGNLTFQESLGNTREREAASTGVKTESLEMNTDEGRNIFRKQPII